MLRGLFVPPFDGLADARLLAELAVEAEAAGWDGMFLWDHIMRPEQDRPVADPWIALSAMAMVTDRIRIGAMVTPPVRRRIAKLAKEIATLDHLSGGRLIVGIGLGVDSGRELSAFGELTDDRRRGDLLDEALPVLRALLAGERVDHLGEHVTVDGVTLLPAALQAPCPPMWMATRTMNRRPLRRAATVEGLFPIEVTPEEVAAMLEVIAAERGSIEGFDVVARSSDGISPEEWERAGATWWFEDIEVGATPADVRSIIANA